MEPERAKSKSFDARARASGGREEADGVLLTVSFCAVDDGCWLDPWSSCCC